MAESRRLLLSVPQVSEALNISVPTVRRWLSSGALPYRKLGGRTLIPQAEVDRVAAEGLRIAKVTV
jgi:excisionase family DNA binding protein